MIGLRYFVCLLVFLLFGCFANKEKDYKDGLSALEKKNFKSAMNYFDRVIGKYPGSPESILAAKEGARVARYDAKDFQKSLKYLRQIVRASPSPHDRAIAQKQIVDIELDEINDYRSSVNDINRLISLDLPAKDKSELRFKLARAYFFLNDFSQAESEVLSFLKEAPNKELVFAAKILLGNIYLSKKDHLKAIDVLRGLMDENLERSIKEGAAMTLVVTYEDMKDFQNAIDTLETIREYHHTPEYIDIRISKLRADQKNQPGARGVNRK